VFIATKNAGFHTTDPVSTFEFAGYESCRLPCGGPLHYCVSHTGDHWPVLQNCKSNGESWIIRP